MSPFAIIFAQDGEFVATRAAERALRGAGFALGPSQRGAPRAVMFGLYTVAKWRNLSGAERRGAHATLAGDGRHGPLTFRLLPAAPDAAVVAAEALRLALAQAEASQ